MAEAGYKKVRLARGDGRLFLLLATDGRVYARPLFQYRRPGILYPGRCPAGRVITISAISRSPGRPLSLAMPAPPPLRAETRGARRSQFRRRGFDDGDGKPQPDGFLYELSALSLERLCGTAFTAPVRGQLYPRCAAVAGKGRARGGGTAAALPAQGFPYKTDGSTVRHRADTLRRGDVLLSVQRLRRPFDPLCAAGQGSAGGWMSCCSIIRRISPRRYASKAR